MIAEFEKIAPDTGSSFKLIKWRSKNDRFFWHQHPEHEIIYVKKGSGKLHIGEHMGQYQEGEVLFLGANLPHTGLGYGLIDEHEEIIIQLKADFLGNQFLDVPELNPIKKLFDRSALGIAFSGPSATKVGELMEALVYQTGIQKLLSLLEILKILAQSSTFKTLNSRENKYDFKQQDEERINKIYNYVENNYKEPIDINSVAELIHLTVPSFCRYFKKMTQLTFTNFLNEFRINNACKMLGTSKNITEVCFDSGFNNISYFNKKFKQSKGKSPKEYRKEFKDKFID